jgi:hypothetical protein
MKKTRLILATAICFIIAATACGGGKSDADKARLETLDSLETEIDQSIRELEEKTDELEELIDDLDTTTVYK